MDFFFIRYEQKYMKMQTCAHKCIYVFYFNATCTFAYLGMLDIS